jgi:hypothetical protein
MWVSAPPLHAQEMTCLVTRGAVLFLAKHMEVGRVDHFIG